ncbi:unnamed protein product [Rotaria sp. Silwood1]|nr:unnamed protein product [Rotaria sp. Silwood1]CAF4866365.1 unnamed protein product [Rotaria sp. Silwood1]
MYIIEGTMQVIEQNQETIQIIFGIPSFLLLRFLGTTRYLSLSMILWGSVMIGMAFVTNARELLVLRFILGMIVAAYFPGITIYLSLWYRKAEQTMRISLFFGAAITAGIFGGIISYGIAQIRNLSSLKDWQWIFLLEGIPIILLGVLTYLFLSSIPETVQWLNNSEKELLTYILRTDAGMSNGEPESDDRISWRQVRYVIIDWRVYLYIVIAIGNLGVIKCLTLFLPSLVGVTSGSNSLTHLLVAPPYVLACLCSILGGYSSSRQKEHGFHIVFFLFIALIGFILMIILFDQNKVAMYISSCIACSGIYGAFPLLLSWFTINIGGHTKRALAVCCFMAIGQLGGALANQIYGEVNKPTYRQGHLICSGAIIIALVTTFILRYCLKRENDRRSHLSSSDYEREAAVKEPCDWVILFNV